MKRLAVIAGALALAGCASVTRGVNEEVVIDYEPAGATVTTSLNNTCTASPCTIQVARKTAFQVTASMPGFQTQVVEVKTRVSGKGAAGMAGNVVIGGVVGMGVDAATGATLDHVPNPVVIRLQPLDAAPAAEPATPAAKPAAPAPAGGKAPVS